MEESSQPANTAQRKSQTSGLAIASLVCGLIFFIPLASLAAIILGIIALQKIREERLEGKGLAITGMVLGSVSLILIAVVFFGTVIFFSAKPDTFLPQRCNFQMLHAKSQKASRLASQDEWLDWLFGVVKIF